MTGSKHVVSVEDAVDKCVQFLLLLKETGKRRRKRTEVEEVEKGQKTAVERRLRIRKLAAEEGRQGEEEDKKR